MSFSIDLFPRTGTSQDTLGPIVSYRTVANKTFPYDEERRNFILRLRTMSLKNGREYARANYEFAEWCAQAVNDLLVEAAIEKVGWDCAPANDLHGDMFS